MKKLLSLVLALVLLCGCMFTLASCGGLSGKYESGLTTYEFKGNNFTRTTSIAGFSYSASGTYEITEEGEDKFITLTYTSGDEKAKEDEAGVALPFVSGAEEGVKYIKIAGRKFTQVK